MTICSCTERQRRLSSLKRLSITDGGPGLLHVSSLPSARGRGVGEGGGGGGLPCADIIINCLQASSAKSTARGLNRRVKGKVGTSGEQAERGEAESGEDKRSQGV